MTNPYAVSSPVAAADSTPHRPSRLQLLVSLPLYLLGVLNTLALVLTPYTIGEALRRAQQHGWHGMLADRAFVELLLRATHTPLVGMCLLTIAFGFHRGKTGVFYAGILTLFGSLVLLCYLFP